MLKPNATNIKLAWKFLKDYRTFKKEAAKVGIIIHWKDKQPMLYDDTGVSGFEPHYTYHPAWAARVVAKINPKFHVDISSILHFSTIVSAFVPVKFYDFRPAALKLGNLSSEQGGLLNLPFTDNSVESISCLHVAEHIGLGRYGDPIDPTGDMKAMKELARVTAIGGNLLFSVPIGKPLIRYNAHRIYSYDQLVAAFGGMEIKNFSLITDDGRFVENATKEESDQQNYGCGCFWFIKK